MNDAAQRQAEEAAPTFGDFWDSVYPKVTQDDLCADYEDARFSYAYGSEEGVFGGHELTIGNSSGEVTVTFDSNDPNACPEGTMEAVDVSIPEPLSAREHARIAAHGECDFPTKKIEVEVEFSRKSMTVETRTAEIDGTPQTYYRYTVTYAWTVAE